LRVAQSLRRCWHLSLDGIREIASLKGLGGGE